eukprot:TRINITY_DN10833_c0_g1_i1.p1 TRINITY_DN10833_c0_g1~~TRINITY_DN10833_c0_g1_i1.p1  ORF type:complete len:188 (+),score=56.82 TRINITY_DN10833_c0_g1_i1:61-564(+)
MALKKIVNLYGKRMLERDCFEEERITIQMDLIKISIELERLSAELEYESMEQKKMEEDKEEMEEFLALESELTEQEKRNEKMNNDHPSEEITGDLCLLFDLWEEESNGEEDRFLQTNSFVITNQSPPPISKEKRTKSQITPEMKQLGIHFIDWLNIKVNQVDLAIGE